MKETDQRQSHRAEVAELVDALGSGSSRGFPVGVRVSPSAPLFKPAFLQRAFCFLSFIVVQTVPDSQNIKPHTSQVKFIAGIAMILICRFQRPLF